MRGNDTARPPSWRKLDRSLFAPLVALPRWGAETGAAAAAFNTRPVNSHSRDSRAHPSQRASHFCRRFPCHRRQADSTGSDGSANEYTASFVATSSACERNPCERGRSRPKGPRMARGRESESRASVCAYTYRIPREDRRKGRVYDASTVHTRVLFSIDKPSTRRLRAGRPNRSRTRVPFDPTKILATSCRYQSDSRIRASGKTGISSTVRYGISFPLRNYR